MGDKSVRSVLAGDDRRRFERRLLDDLRTLDWMIESGRIESGVRRLGAEQELFLVDRAFRPAAAALELLRSLDDPHATTELGLFQLELNVEPLPCGGAALTELEQILGARIERVRSHAAALGVQPVLTGILPTLRLSDLALDSMTPLERYRELNRAMTELRGGSYELHVRGLDELMLQHDSVMFEACTASFQVHLQIGAEEFARFYNAAQAAAGPVLAVSANSPLLFGRRLWSETRIALFQQAVDTRNSLRFLRERSPRVTFGEGWVRHSVLELFREDVVRFRALVTGDPGGDPLELRALQLFNGTVYRWNRACYGTSGGQPHLRIECRILPAGPTVVDEVANAAFWIGLVAGLAEQDVAQVMEFEEAKANFHAAARQGLDATLSWLGKTARASTLVNERLLPVARQGLVRLGIDDADAERYLAEIHRRVSTCCGGAQWLAGSLARLRARRTSGDRMTALTAALLARQTSGRPVSEWELMRPDEAARRRDDHPRVDQHMTTELFTVGEDESLDLVAELMAWKRIRHVPVEDAKQRLVGLVSYRRLLRLLAHGRWTHDGSPIAVREVMVPDPVTIGPRATIREAIALMRAHGISCLPVVESDQLLGIITERDLIELATEALDERLS